MVHGLDCRVRRTVLLSSMRLDGNQKVQHSSVVNKEIVSLNLFQEERSVPQLGWLTSTCAPSLRTPVRFVTETAEEVWSLTTLTGSSINLLEFSPTTWAATPLLKVETSIIQQISPLSSSSAGSRLPNILTFVPPVTDWIRDNADSGRFCSKETDSQREGQ